MKKLYFALYILCTLTGNAGVQNSTSLFSQYPVNNIYRGKAAPLNLKDHEDAHMFKTRIREELKKGANFAGLYTIASIGIGCRPIHFGWLIDTKTGNILCSLPTFSPNEENPNTYFFKIDSNLLIDVHESFSYEENEVEYKNVDDKSHVKFYKWENNEFKQIAELIMKDGETLKKFLKCIN